LAKPSVRLILADDFAPFRRFLSSLIKQRRDIQIVYEATNGAEVVQKAQESQPDLILLDIGLPKLDGIEAARQIRRLCPKSKILFVSLDSSFHMVQAALCTGALGYVVKTDAKRELLPAIDAILRGDRFIGARFATQDLAEDANSDSANRIHDNKLVTPLG
jgi:DNA-binding NarL/FixJ family response regulator